MCSEGWLAHHRHSVNESHLYFIGKRLWSQRYQGRDVMFLELGKVWKGTSSTQRASAGVIRGAPPKVPWAFAGAALFILTHGEMGPSRSSLQTPCPVRPGGAPLKLGSRLLQTTTLITLGKTRRRPRAAAHGVSVTIIMLLASSYYFMAQYWTRI